LYTAGLDPSIMIGGEVPFLDYKGGKFGKGKWGVYESDESDGTFLNYRSDIKIVTNIDNDHLDHYKSENNLLEAFAEFIHNNNSSYCFLDLDDKGIQEAIKLLIKKHNLHFIMNINHDIPSILSKDDITETILIQKYYIEDHSLYFDRDGYLRKLVLPYTGDHYLKNAFLALLVAEKIGVEVDFSLEVLRNYTGVKRRLEYLGNKNGIKVYDDYGHHPTEIKAVIQSLKQMRKLNEKCCVIFQPHRYTRTRDHYLEFAKSLDEANLVFLLPIYSAEETPIEGISSDLIYQEMENKDSCLLLTGKLEEDISIIEKNLLTGDFLVSLGAGSVRNWAQEFLR
jgi:UDP-N-acetylmuramate--alanine ligase